MCSDELPTNGYQSNSSTQGTPARLIWDRWKSTFNSFELSFVGLFSLKAQDERRFDQSNSEALFSEPFKKLRGLSEAMSAKNLRIVVLVDDLDRCTPETIVNVIETIHTLTDLERFVFVLALDYEYLASAIRNRYPTSDEHQFIENIVQVPFQIPPVEFTSESVAEVIGYELWREIHRDWLDGD